MVNSLSNDPRNCEVLLLLHLAKSFKLGKENHIPFKYEFKTKIESTCSKTLPQYIAMFLFRISLFLAMSGCRISTLRSVLKASTTIHSHTSRSWIKIKSSRDGAFKVFTPRQTKGCSSFEPGLPRGLLNTTPFFGEDIAFLLNLIGSNTIQHGGNRPLVAWWARDKLPWRNLDLWRCC